MAPTALSYVYCTQTDVEQILSANGVTLRLDDDGAGLVSAAEQLRMTDAINGAACTVDFYCFSKYTQAQLATSMFINRAASWLAAYDLCGTRGNEVPESILEEAEKWEEKLAKIESKGGRVPGLPYRMSQCPTMDNTRLDNRYNSKVIRVERRTSTSQATQLPVNVDLQDSMSNEGYGI